MVPKQISLTTPSVKKGFSIRLQPASAWMAILGLLLLSTLLIVAGAGKILNLAFPGGAFIIGVFLYFRYPILYIGFSWWMWFLTPLVRRLADYRGSFTDPSPILLAPYLVLLITLVTLGKHLPKINRQGGLPFILSFIGLAYAYLVGLIQSSPIPVTIALLEWLVPVLFGFHLFANWRNYPSYRQNLERIFTWGVLVMGIYGIIQYLVAPDWDGVWLTNTNMISAGSAEPLQIRVWSTMHSPGVFAVFMMVGLLMLLNQQGAFARAISVIGYLAFLLTLVRGAWIMWFVGLLTHLSFIKSKLRIRIAIILMVLILGVIPLTTIDPFAERITPRLETLFNLEADQSSNDRKALYSQEIDKALMNVMGNGMEKQEILDSGVLDILLSLGWFGGSFYLGGILLLIMRLFQDAMFNLNPFVSICRAISFCSLVGLIFGRQQIGAPGIILWGFLGLGIAACKYNLYEEGNG
ncbi:MAG: O-antigen ligase domain-containing protein [Pleurocapsa minor HA4230-MV1]|jgi:hypothetical protein|nr:O-antigen ligase domain-containing protein [Pleurocapsa minor HA4230-MV1]